MERIIRNDLLKFLLSTVSLAALTACGGGSQTAALDTSTSPATSESPEATFTDEAMRDVAAGFDGTSELQARESASAAAAAATPKVAIMAFSGWNTAAYQDHIARFNVAMLAMPASTPSATMDSVVSALKAKKPGLLLGQYAALNDVDDRLADLVSPVNANNWWLRNAAGSRVQWAGRATSWDANLTGWTVADASGKRWPQWKAGYDSTKFFATRPGLDFVYTDTVFPQAVNSDFKRLGTDQVWTDATIQAASRTGFGNYWTSLRAVNPNLKVVANVSDAWVGSAEFAGKLNGAFLNSMIGKSWSIEATGGWLTMMQRYRNALANTSAPKAVIFNVAASSTDYKTLRYGLTSALLEDGYFSFTATDGAAPAPWMDEFSAPIGTPSETPPTAATSSGIWKRAYSNGMVLVNPSKTASATIAIPSGYERLAGTQDPATNNGAATTSVTLAPRDGLILVKTYVAPVVVPPAAPAPPTSFDKPKTVGLNYTTFTDTAQQAHLAKYRAAILNFWAGLGTDRMKAIVANIKSKNPNIVLVQYTSLNEAPLTTSPLKTAVDANNWWLRNAAGEQVTWAPQFNNREVNITAFTRADATGKRWPQWKAEYDTKTFFAAVPGIDYMYADTVMMPYVSADWELLGMDKPYTDAAAQRAARLGYAANWTAMRSLNPSLKIIGNVNAGWLASAEMAGKLEGAFIEGAMGKSWSDEGLSWDTMMNRYRAAMRDTTGTKFVVQNVYAAATDYSLARYGLASTMLEDGYYCLLTADHKATWIDEFDAPIGKAVEAAPKTATASGIWTRKYENGMVLVNPSKTASATITVDPGYKRLTGTQDPTVNNGQAASSITLGPRQGLLLVKI